MKSEWAEKKGSSRKTWSDGALMLKKSQARSLSKKGQCMK